MQPEQVDAGSAAVAEGEGRSEQLYRHPNARRTPGAESTGTRRQPQEVMASPRRTPSRSGDSTPAYPNNVVWDPIHALSRRSRSNTDGFFSPLIHDGTAAGGTLQSSGPLDAHDVQAIAGSDPTDSAGLAQDVPERDAGPRASEDGKGNRPTSQQRSLAFPSFVPSADPRGRPTKEVLPGLSSETSEDLRRLFSPAGRGFSEALDAAGWRSYARVPTASAQPARGPRSDPRMPPPTRAPPLYPEMPSVLPSMSGSLYRPDPFSSESSSLDLLDAARHHGVRQDAAFSDGLGSFGRSSPCPAEGAVVRPAFADKEVQTDESVVADEAARVRDILELRQARCDMQLLFAENRTLKRQLYDLLTAASAMRSQQGPMLASAGTAPMLGQGRAPDASLDFTGSQGPIAAFPPIAAAAAAVRDGSGGLPNIADPMQALLLSSPSSESIHPAFVGGTVPGRPSPLNPTSGVRPEVPAAMLNQQRILAALASRGQPFYGSQEQRATPVSQLRGGNPMLGMRSDEAMATAGMPTSDTSAARLGSAPSWPTLAEAQKQLLKAKLGAPSESRTPFKGSEGPSPGAASDAGASVSSHGDLLRQILDGRGQEASIVLQQQLKSGSTEVKRSILRLVEGCILALSQDRHGNFLVQRAIGVEPELARKLQGHFVELAMSQFGCHVVQRVLDEDESIKVSVVEELLTSRLEESLTSRNSVHVWQKVLEINWAHPSFRSTIFAVMNRQMKGKWALTARQETGSIICQNIFESADTDEKHDCLEEVLEEAEECASNQWGVWVVQHIIEHGAEDERSAALERLLRSAVKLTLSQYGQKAIMSGLKSGDKAFIEKYVDTLCGNQPGGSSSTGTRRSALVDIALAPQGLQIVTQLLTSVSPEMRDKIISTVRKNSVFLKGSKTGLKVHQLCERARAFSGY
ncbi:meiotic PUF protein 1 [Thecaphora frezii]